MYVFCVSNPAVAAKSNEPLLRYYRLCEYEYECESFTRKLFKKQVVCLLEITSFAVI